MNLNGLLRHGVQIARIERTRSRRQLDRSSVLRILIGVVVIVLAVGSGIAAYTFGTMIRDGQATLPLETLHLVATGGFLALLIGFVQQTSKLTERIDTDHLLTTVSARAIILGVVVAVSSRTAIRMSLTAVSVAVGFAAGTGSPASALTILVAVVGLFALTGLVGAVLSVCGVTVAAATGMRVSYRELVPVPVPLTSTSMRAEVGQAEFVRMGQLLGLLGLVCLPAVFGYLPDVFEPGSTMVGVPSVVIRIGSLAVTTGLAVGVSIVAYRRAVRRFDQYTLS